ncbi:MAG: EAL domain-containing protein [Myxococcota bacterium]
MRPCVLVVDDDYLVLRSVTKMLRTAGFQVFQANTVATALHVARVEELDVALVDYSLLGETGLDVLTALQRIRPRCLRVLMTGRTQADIFVDAVNEGMISRVLRKPFSVREITDWVTEALESARRDREVQTAQRRAEMEAEQRLLDVAIEASRLSLALQPIVSVSGPHQGVPVAYEALLRPKHPVLTSPLAVLAMAERYGQIGTLSTRVLAIAARLMPGLPDNARFFLNLHPAQLGHPESLADDLSDFVPYAHRVVLEITERSRLHDIPRWEESVAWMNEHGFSIAVDDLGAGHSSLLMVADLEPAFLKIDMDLVRNLHHSPRRQRLVSLLQTFAEATQTQVVAEGVETEDEVETLLGCGIHLMQGYYWAMPSEPRPPLVPA